MTMQASALIATGATVVITLRKKKNKFKYLLCHQSDFISLAWENSKKVNYRDNLLYHKRSQI